MSKSADFLTGSPHAFWSLQHFCLVCEYVWLLFIPQRVYWVTAKSSCSHLVATSFRCGLNRMILWDSILSPQLYLYPSCFWPAWFCESPFASPGLIFWEATPQLVRRKWTKPKIQVERQPTCNHTWGGHQQKETQLLRVDSPHFDHQGRVEMRLRKLSHIQPSQRLRLARRVEKALKTKIGEAFNIPWNYDNIFAYFRT